MKHLWEKLWSSVWNSRKAWFIRGRQQTESGSLDDTQCRSPLANFIKMQSWASEIAIRRDMLSLLGVYCMHLVRRKHTNHCVPYYTSLSMQQRSLYGYSTATLTLSLHGHCNKKQTNSVALVRERTTLIARPPLVGEVSVNFCGYRVSRGQRDESPQQYPRLLSCTHEAVWTSLQTHYFSENLVAPGMKPGPADLQPGALTTRLQRQSAITELLSKWYNGASFVFCLRACLWVCT
jgi:hypothetical protein